MSWTSQRYIIRKYISGTRGSSRSRVEIHVCCAHVVLGINRKEGFTAWKGSYAQERTLVRPFLSHVVLKSLCPATCLSFAPNFHG